MVSGVSVGKTEVEPADGTDTWHQLLLLTLRLVALVRKHLLLRPHLAVVFYVGRDCEVRHGSSRDRYGLATQWAHGDLDVLFVRAATIMIVILEMVLAEYFTAGVALHREEVQLSAGCLTAVPAQVR